MKNKQNKSLFNPVLKAARLDKWRILYYKGLNQILKNPPEFGPTTLGVVDAIECQRRPSSNLKLWEH